MGIVVKMDVTIASAENLPEQAYFSVRVGETRRMMAYRPSGTLHIDTKSAPPQFIVDIFEKVASKQVKLADLALAEDGTLQKNMELVSSDGTRMQLGINVNCSNSSDVSALKSQKEKRDENTVDAKNYLDKHGVESALQSMIHRLLIKQPEDALAFMCDYLSNQKNMRLKSCEKNIDLDVPDSSPTHSESFLPNWAIQPGLGSEEFPGFPSDGSAPLPDISRHENLAMKFLNKNPSTYECLKDVRTPSGVSLATCVKTGVDNAGSRFLKTLGLVAGDSSCYDVFKEVFHPVISEWHGCCVDGHAHQTNLDPRQITDTSTDELKEHVLAVKVIASRSISNFRMPPAISFEERREVERLIASAFKELPGDLKGTYYSLRGSCSSAANAELMTEEVENDLRSLSSLFKEPESPALLSAGYGRDWPDARGVFINKEKRLAIWVNEIDHIRFTTWEDGGDLRSTFHSFVRTEKALGLALFNLGYTYASSEQLGFLVSLPTLVGTAMQVNVTLRLSKLSRRQEFTELRKNLGLKIRAATIGAKGGLLDLYSDNTLSGSETDQVNEILENCKLLVDAERQCLDISEPMQLSNYVSGDITRTALERDCQELVTQDAPLKQTCEPSEKDVEDKETNKTGGKDSNKTNRINGLRLRAKEILLNTDCNECLLNITSVPPESLNTGTVNEVGLGAEDEERSTKKSEINDVESFRLQMKTILLQACEDGSLTKFLAKTEHESG